MRNRHELSTLIGVSNEFREFKHPTEEVYIGADQQIIGPSGVCALPLAAGRNKGGHYFKYFGPSGVRALPLAAGINEGGHYFRYFCQPQARLKPKRCLGGFIITLQ